MRRLALAAFLLFCVSPGLEARVPLAKSGAKLEAITTPFPDLKSFLANKRALAEYGTALEQYYGRARFPCESFTSLIQDLTAFVAAAPVLAERVWKRSDLLPIEIVWRETTDSPEQKFRFVPAARPFHAIWEDLSQRACPRSDCRQANLSAPARWAVLLEGAQLYRVEAANGFSGATVLVSQVLREGKPLPLLSLSAHPLFAKKGWATMTAGRAPRSASLVEHFAEGANLEAAVRVEASSLSVPSLRSVGNANIIGTLADLAFVDPTAEVFEKKSNGRCSTGGKGGLLSGFGVLAPTKNVSTTVLPPASPAAANSSEKEALMQIVLNLAGKKAAPSEPVEIELLLNRALQSEEDESRRAQAALGLNFLGRQFVDPGERARFAEGKTTEYPAVNYLLAETPANLEAALKDKSENVRGLAALGLAATPDGFKRDGVAPNLASRITPEKFLPDGSPARSALNPSDLLSRQLDPLLRNNVPVPREMIDRLFDRVAEETNPQQKRELVDRIVSTYLKGTRMEAYQTLRQNLIRHPGLATEVLGEIDRQGITGCDEPKKTPGGRG